MNILTSNQIDESVSFPRCVNFVSYVDEESGFLGPFTTVTESKTEAIIDGRAVLVHTIEFHGKFYYKFTSPVDQKIGPLYVPFDVQDPTDLLFGSEMKNMHEFKTNYVLVFDDIFHNSNSSVDVSVVATASDIIDDVSEHDGFPSEN